MAAGGRCGAGGPRGRPAAAGRAHRASFGGGFALDSGLAETGEARVPERSAGGFGGLSLPGQRVKPSPPELPERLSAVTEAGASWADPALSWGAGGLWASWGLQLGAGTGRRCTTYALEALMVSVPLGSPRRRGSSAVSPEPWRVSLGCLGAGATCALVDFSSRSSFRVRPDFEGSCSLCGFSSVTADCGPAPGQSLARLLCWPG